MAFDPHDIDDPAHRGLDEDERDFFDVEGREGYSWEYISSDNNPTEGWGDASRSPVSGRQRRRRYDGD